MALVAQKESHGNTTLTNQNILEFGCMLSIQLSFGLQGVVELMKYMCHV